MSYPTVKGQAVEGVVFREAQSNLTPTFASAYYQFYLSGTTTPTNVYQNGTLATPFSPTGKVAADAYGRFPAIWLDPSVIYRVRLYNSSNVQQWQNDPYYSQLSTFGTSSLSAYGPKIATTGEVTIPAPNSGGTGISLTLYAGAIGTSALELNGTLAGNSALIVNTSATTGAQTATFAATNKPGTSASAPAGWLPITCDGVQYYAPMWFDNNNFTPYTANPGANGEVITGTSVTFGGNGVTTATGGTATPGNWFSPTSTGIGAGYYINITKTGGTVNFATAQGSWVNIGAGGLTISRSGVGTATGTYQLSTSASGSPVVANGTISLAPFSQTDTYTSGSGVETVPAAATSLSIYVVGAGAGGAQGGAGEFGGVGGGGGGGAQAVSTGIAVTAGQTLNYSVPSGGAGSNGGNGGSPAAATVTGNGALSAVSLSAGSGVGATYASGGGAGGTASGGNSSNTSGSAGSNNSFNLHIGVVAGSGGNSASGAAGGGTAGANGSPPGGGGAGSSSGVAGNGANGQIQFVYSST